MTKILFFGTCSGTEPMDGMLHSSFAIEKNGYYYWFDAGEGCSRTAHLMGVNLTNIKSIFISHPHIDHLGGFLNLIFNIKKLASRRGTLPPDKQIRLFMPEDKEWECFKQALEIMECRYEGTFDIIYERINDRVLYKDESIMVEAVHNHHLAPSENGDYRSFSFRIFIDGKKVVYSGDVRNMDDIKRVIGDGCDYLIMETGHHKVLDVCAMAEGANVGKLLFTHHGREIINDPDTADEQMKNCAASPVICRDKMVVEI